MLRHAFWGGVYASCGYQWAPISGATYSAGLLGSSGAVIVILTSLLIAAALSL